MDAPLVLLYHDVLKSSGETSGFRGTDTADYKLPIHVFEAQVKSIAGQKKPIVFTFDDGGVSALTNVAPLLEQYGFKGHFFIPSAYVGQPGFLSENQVKELYRMGHIIGSHGHSHRSLSHMPYTEILKEWQDSKKILSDITGSEITEASLPGGWYSRAVAKAAGEAGIKTLYTSEPAVKSYPVESCIVSGRFNINEQTDISGVLNDTGYRDELHRSWRRKELLKRLLGKWYLGLRKIYK